MSAISIGYVLGGILLYWISLAQYMSCFYEHQHTIDCNAPDRVYDSTFHNLQIGFSYLITIIYVVLAVFMFITP